VRAWRAALAATLLVAGRLHAQGFPKVVLIGDSIRLGYAPFVQKALADRAVVISPQPNAGDSRNLLKNVDRWVVRERPDVVHFNCGIHDSKRNKRTGQLQVPRVEYAANLRRIVLLIRNLTDAKVVFATTTPILDDRAAAALKDADYELSDARIAQYNGVARKVMQELDVPIDDLNGVLADPDVRSRTTVSDGVHFTREGFELLGGTVARFIAERLPPRPLRFSEADAPLVGLVLRGPRR